MDNQYNNNTYNSNSDKENTGNDEFIKSFKDEFKKKSDNTDEAHKKEINDTKHDVKNPKGKIKRLLPFLLVFISFFVGIYIIGFILDQWVIPSIVHNRKIVTIPKVEGRKLEQAESLLSQMNLSYEISSKQFSDIIPEGSVIKQLPAAGAKVKSGRPVYITLSKGKEKVVVPALKNKTLREARIELMKRGLVLGNVEYEYNEETPKDSVFSQSIIIGEKVEFGDTVSVKVSLGSESMIEMPFLIGMNIEEVKKLLFINGLTLGSVIYEENETFLSNTVIEQKPYQFSPVQKGALVKIIVAK